MSNAEKIRASAAALIPHVVAERDEKLAEFKSWHDADKASFHFRCDLHGGFLAIFMTRGPKPPSSHYGYGYYGEGAPTNKIVTTINLAASRIFSLTLGSEPAMDGTVTFSADHSGAVREVYPSRPYGHRMIEIDQLSPQHGHMGYFHHDDPLRGMHVKDCPRAALDDSIYFVGPGVKLFAPATLGQSMYETILAALGSEG